MPALTAPGGYTAMDIRITRRGRLNDWETQCPHRNHGKMTDYHRAGAVIKPGEAFARPWVKRRHAAAGHAVHDRPLPGLSTHTNGSLDPAVTCRTLSWSR